MVGLNTFRKLCFFWTQSRKVLLKTVTFPLWLPLEDSIYQNAAIGGYFYHCEVLLVFLLIDFTNFL